MSTIRPAGNNPDLSLEELLSWTFVKEKSENLAKIKELLMIEPVDSLMLLPLIEDILQTRKSKGVII